MYWLSMFSALCILGASATGPACEHKPATIIGGVRQRRSDKIDKRQTLSESIRIHFHYDSTINNMLDATQQNHLQNTVIPALENTFESSLSVIRATSPILLERGCSDRNLRYLPVSDPMRCVNSCLDTPMCGMVQIPEDHLKRCVECNGTSFTCNTRPGLVDGSGVPDTDLIIYVSAFDCSDLSSNVLAFASACQMESQLDRPIAGYLNFCPHNYDSRNDDRTIRVGVHEVIHILAFSSGLYRWYRDENGDPRTPRDQYGFPPSDPSNNTIRTETYTDWSTRNGLISHQVSLLVTPKVIEQARLHFDCADITGVEIENQGGGGTATSHWEQRVLGNEVMSGFVLFSSPISRITLALLEDTGWYVPNYEMADPLAWGLNTGCTIPHGSCREYITQQRVSGGSISPYCDELDDTTVGCTVDHEYLSYCNLASNVNPPSQFQFFDASARYGGRLESTDYCPFENDISLTRCSEASNSPIISSGQVYGEGSRCFQLGRDWTRTNKFGTRRYTTDAGCYQYNCTSSGVKIILEGMSIPCSCEGEEIVVDVNVSSVRYQGSYICPSCASVCYDDLASCPSTETAPCPGQVTMYSGVPDPCQSNPCDANAVCTRDSVLKSNFTCACKSGFVGDGFSCEVVCSDLIEPENGIVIYTNGFVNNRPAGAVATYTCETGYTLSDSESHICGSNGIWSGLPPTCDAVECGSLANPTNGQVDTSSGTIYGSTATYTCRTGYTLSGSQSRTCGSNEIWSGSPPTCDVIDCGSLANPTNGQVETSSGTTFGNTATYNCSTGYTLSGSPSRTCGANGLWSSNDTICQSVDCGRLANPENGIAHHQNGTAYQTQVTYTCDKGYTLSGVHLRTCGANGSWNLSPPSCLCTSNFTQNTTDIVDNSTSSIIVGGTIGGLLIVSTIINFLQVLYILHLKKRIHSAGLGNLTVRSTSLQELIE